MKIYSCVLISGKYITFQALGKLANGNEKFNSTILKRTNNKKCFNVKIELE